MKPLDWEHMQLHGRHLIEANAGTGKTHSLVNFYARLVLQHGLLPEQILMVTFTRAATQELRQRLHTKLQRLHALASNAPGEGEDEEHRLLALQPDCGLLQSHLSQALAGMDRAAVFTINGFCEQVLKNHHQLCGEPLMLDLQVTDKPMLNELLDRHWRRCEADLPAWLGVHLQNSQLGLNADNPLDKYTLTAWVSDLLALHAHEQRQMLDWRDAVAGLEDLRGKIAEAWQEEREAFVQLVASPAINKRSYPEAGVHTRLQLMDAFCTQGDIGGGLSKLAWSTFRNAYNKKFKEAAQPLRFQRLLDDFQAQWIDFARGFLCQALQHTRKSLTQRQQITGVYDYDDQIRLVHRAVLDSDALAQRLAAAHPVIMIDEFQDTDARQYALFDRIHAVNSAHLLVMVGDPKQAIYAFRGADVFVYGAVRSRCEHRHALLANWRSSAAMITAINAHYSHNPRAFGLPWIEYQASLTGGQATVTFVDAQRHKPVSLVRSTGAQSHVSALVAEVMRLLDGTVVMDGAPLHGGQVAVLCASNRSATECYEALIAAAVPAVLWSGQTVFECDMAWDVYALLNALLKPDPQRIHALWLTPLLLHRAKADDAGTALRQISSWRQQLDREGLPAVLHAVDIEWSIAEHMMRHVDGERRLTDWLHLLELLADHWRAHGGHPQRTLRWFARQLNSGGEDSDNEAIKRRLDCDAQAVAVMTAHKSKGLEFAAVVLADAEKLLKKENKAPLHMPAVLHDGFAAVMQWRPDQLHIQRAADEVDWEKQRLMYVALTRAKHRLVLMQAAAQGSSDLDAWADVAMADHVDVVDLDRSKIEQTALLTERSNETAPPVPPRAVHRPAEAPLSIYSYSGLAARAADLRQAPVLWSEAGVDDDLEAQAERPGIHDFPRGARAGSALHEVLEHTGVSVSQADLRVAVDAALEKYGFEARWGESLTAHLGRLLDTPLKPLQRALKRADAVLYEMEFLLPVAHLAADRMAHWLSEHRGEDVEFSHAELSGFLTGSVDVFMRCGDKYYVLDYKSNHLGHDATAYSADALQSAVRSHDYDAQYLLYSAAVCRYMQVQDAGFTLNDFGGVLYVFLRGLDHPETQGVYFNRPDATLLQEIIKALSVTEQPGVSPA